MKKILIPCSFIAMTLMSFSSNNLDSDLEKNNLENKSLELPQCTEYVSVDCDGDGREDLGWEVACEHADAMREQFQQTCLGN